MGMISGAPPETKRLPTNKLQRSDGWNLSQKTYEDLSVQNGVVGIQGDSAP